MGRWLLFAVLLAGCRATGAFECATDQQCRHGMTNGNCENTGYCSFRDDLCESRSRYDDNAPSAYAGQCVPLQAIDAAIDAPFSIADCPTTYTGQIPSTVATSRYRLVDLSFTAWQLVADCDDDLLGHTHAVIPEAPLELAELSTWISGMAHTNDSYFAGAVQAPNATSPAQGWLLFDGSPLPTADWDFGEPDDGDNSENNHAEQLVYFSILSTGRHLADLSGTAPRGIVCECDGKTWGAAARAAYDADPNNPN